MKNKIRKKQNKAELREFFAEARDRLHEGYSMRQLIQSHIPEIGSEKKVKDSEVTAFIKKRAMKAETFPGEGE